ncbi:MAG: TonB-dependent receptor, partial [Candidatus Latescibacterota bacterium]
MVDSEGKAIAFANVNVTSPSLQGGRGVMSTSEGYFGVFKLPVGIYTVKVSHVSYQDVTFEEVSVRLGRTTTLGKVTLTVKTFEAPAIIVTEKKPLIDPTSAAISVNLVSKEFEDLPLDRDYQNMPALLPHANESFFGDGVNFAGSPGQENKYFVDGVETTDPFRGVSGTSLPYNFVEEVQVKTGGYEAEYRSSLGGIVNVISHSGSNEVHGQVFGFFQNNEFSREPRLSFEEPPETDFANYDVGLSLGGPVKRDKLWFFGAYNPSFVNEDVIVPGLGFKEDKAVRHIFAGKLTWRPTDRTNVGLTATGDPGTRDAVFTGATAYESLDPVLADVTTGGVNLALKGTHLVNDALIVEASIARIARTDKVEAATEAGRSEVAFIDQETGVASGGFKSPSDAYSVQTTADVEASYILGKH